jgi:hypothetical protein
VWLSLCARFPPCLDHLQNPRVCLFMYRLFHILVLGLYQTDDKKSPKYHSAHDMNTHHAYLTIIPVMLLYNLTPFLREQSGSKCGIRIPRRKPCAVFNSGKGWLLLDPLRAIPDCWNDASGHLTNDGYHGKTVRDVMMCDWIICLVCIMVHSH